MSPCPDCDGTGEVLVHEEREVNYTEMDDCPRCDGTGDIDAARDLEDQAYRAAEASWQDQR